MKRICKIFIIIIMAVFFLGILLNPKSVKWNINIQDTAYVEIRYHNKTHKISNNEIINELVTKINDLKIKKFHPYISKVKDMQYGSSKNSYIMSLYESGNRNNKLCEVQIISDSLIRINGEIYKVSSSSGIYSQIREITKYCIVPLPEIRINNIYQYSTSDNTNLSKEEIYELYCRILDCKPITESQFAISEEYAGIVTYDDEKIDMYSLDNKVYIRYTKGNITCFFVYNGIEG